MDLISIMRAAATRQRRIWAEGHAAVKLARRAARGGFFQLDWGRAAASIEAARSGAISLDGSDNDFWVHAAQDAERQEAAAAARSAGRKAS